MSEEIKVILEEIRFKAGIYRDQKRRNEAFNDDDYKCYVLLDYLQQKENIRKEVREYITGYDSISILQGLDNIEGNKDLDDKTIREMIRRYMIVHDHILEILDKEKV